MSSPANTADNFITRLRNAGIEPGDGEDLRQQKSLLVFISGLISLASILWLMIYSWMGPKFSSSLPFTLQVLVALNLWAYIQFRNFELFRVALIGLLLFFPFVAQWAIGDFVSASGLILWGLLAPICALLCMGVRESIPWFAAYLVLTLATGVTDYLLADYGTVTAASASISRRTSMVFFALNFITLSTLIYLLLRFALLDRAKARAALELAHTKLAAEQARSERLLLNILPAPVADRLKQSNDTIADGFAEVSVMFADIVNFTEMAAGMQPDQVFAMLNRVFSSFDELAEMHGLEKIKTIGDAYMVAGGLSEHATDACIAIAELALDMHEWLRADQCSRSDDPLRVRIGIGTGPVVAGVVGKKKFIYDLWGDTVNLASRITDESLPDGIQCDRASYERLKHRYSFDGPLYLKLKGKGEVEVWRLTARR